MFYPFRDDFQTTLENEFQPLLFENDFKAIIPESFLVLACLLLLVYGVIYSGHKQNNYPVLINNVTWLGLLALFFTLILLINGPLKEGTLFYNTLVIDHLTRFLKVLLLLGTFSSVLISMKYVEEERLNSFEMIILLLLSTSSMLFLISSADLITMYLAIELQSLCFYVIAALKRNSEFSTEAGLKYFLLGAFSSGILLFGCSLIYGFTGVTNFGELGKILTCIPSELLEESSVGLTGQGTLLGLPTLRGCELGMIFILVAFLFKISAVPFHMWAPDVYEGAPTSVTAFFSIVPKISVLAVFLRLFFDGFYNLIFPWQDLLAFCSISSMLLGALAALSQNKIKRLLAFSSIGHVGYLLIAFSCGTIEGIQALLIYLVVYIIMTINLFAIVMSPLRREGMEDTNTDLTFITSKDAVDQTFIASQAHTKIQRVKYTTDLAFLGKSNPILAITLTITIFSIAGIPPLAGFYSKAFLVFAAVSSSQYILALIAVLTSVISSFYYIRIVKIMYFESPAHWLSFMQVSKESSILLGCTFSFLLLFFLYPTPLFLITHKVALFLSY